LDSPSSFGCFNSYQLVLIADPYSDRKFFEKNDSAAKKEVSEM